MLKPAITPSINPHPKATYTAYIIAASRYQIPLRVCVTSQILSRLHTLHSALSQARCSQSLPIYSFLHGVWVDTSGVLNWVRLSTSGMDREYSSLPLRSSKDCRRSEDPKLLRTISISDSGISAIVSLSSLLPQHLLPRIIRWSHYAGTGFEIGSTHNSSLAITATACIIKNMRPTVLTCIMSTLSAGISTWRVIGNASRVDKIAFAAIPVSTGRVCSEASKRADWHNTTRVFLSIHGK